MYLSYKLHPFFYFLFLQGNYNLWTLSNQANSLKFLFFLLNRNNFTFTNFYIIFLEISIC